MQLRLALSDAENAFQQGPLLLVCIRRTFWRKEEPPQTGGGRDVSAEPHPSCGKHIQIIINKCAVAPPHFQKMELRGPRSALAPLFNESPYLFNSRTDLASTCRMDTALLSPVFYSWIHLIAQ